MRPPRQLAGLIRVVRSGRPRPLNASGKVTIAGNSYFHPLLAIALFAILVPSSPAQVSPRSVPAGVSSPHFAPRPGTLAVARKSRLAHRMHRAAPLTSFLSPFFGDSFDPEDLSSAGAPPFLLEATRALSGSNDFAGQPDNTREPSSSQPLLIELQGGRYVHVSSAAIDGEALPLPLPLSSAKLPRDLAQHQPSAHPLKSAAQDSANASTSVATSAHDLPPAVLVFHDGHREEVHDYAITAGFLYARGDYYTDGYWNKKIDLSTLDVTQTVQANATRNVNFVLPASPNEVITRP